MKNKLRKIKVDNETYLWKREHNHLEDFEYSKCVEKVTIYLEGYKNSPINLLFREEDNLKIKNNLNKEKWCVGYPDAGVIWLFKPRADKKPQTENIHINLNRPAVIAELIKYFNNNGWNPKEVKKSFVIEDALKFLDVIKLPLGIH